MASLDRASGIKVAEAIDKRVRLVSKDLYNNAPYNKKMRGRVVSAKGKRYTIEINKAIYTNVYALKSNYTIKVGDVVICEIPNNQYSDIFIEGVLDTD